MSSGVIKIEELQKLLPEANIKELNHSNKYLFHFKTNRYESEMIDYLRRMITSKFGINAVFVFDKTELDIYKLGDVEAVSQPDGFSGEKNV